MLQGTPALTQGTCEQNAYLQDFQLYIVGYLPVDSKRSTGVLFQKRHRRGFRQDDTVVNMLEAKKGKC